MYSYLGLTVWLLVLFMISSKTVAGLSERRTDEAVGHGDGFAPSTAVCLSRGICDWGS